MLDLTGRKALSTREAGRYLGIAWKTLQYWRFEKRGPAYCKLGKKVAYRLEDLDAFLERNVIEPKGAA